MPSTKKQESMPTKITSPELIHLFISNILPYLDCGEQKVLNAVCRSFKELCLLPSLNNYFFSGLSNQPISKNDLLLVHEMTANSTYTIRRFKNGSLKDRFRPSSQRIQGNDGPINTLSISPDETQMVSGSDQGKITIWDLKTKKVIDTWPAHQGKVLSTTIFPNAEGLNELISTSEDETITIWNLNTKTPIDTYPAPFTELFISNGPYILRGSPDCETKKGVIRVSNLANKTLLAELQGHTDWVQAVDIDPDGGCLVSGAKDGVIKIWNVVTQECLHTLEEHTGAITKIILVLQEGKIFSASEDRTVKIWEIRESKRNKTIFHKHFSVLQGHTAAVRVIKVFRHNFVVSGSDDTTIRFWDITGLCLRILNRHTGAVRAIALVNNGQEIISGAEDGTIIFWGKLCPLLEDVLPQNTPLKKTARLILLDIWQYLEIVVNKQNKKINILTSSAIEFALNRIQELPKEIQKEFFSQVEAKKNPLQSDHIVPLPPRTQNVLMRFFPLFSPSMKTSVKQFLNRIDLLPQEVKDAFYEKARIYANENNIP
jgi:WD40 repeat protein